MTIKEIYGRLACVKKKKGMYIIYIFNCNNGLEEIYKTSPNLKTTKSNLKKKNFILIPQNIFEDEGKRLRKYLNKS